jgi:TldD protein
MTAIQAAGIGLTLQNVCHELTAGLERHRPAGAADIAAAAESGVHLRGRYADGRITEASAALRTGACVRAYTDGTYHQVASATPGPGMVHALYGGSLYGGSLYGGSLYGGSRPVPRRAFAPIGAPAPADVIDLAALRDFLAALDASARDTAPVIGQVVTDFEVTDRLFCAGNRLDHRRVGYLTIRAIARRGSALATGIYTPGLAGPLTDLNPAELGAEAARRAVAKLGARPAPVGRFPVIVRGGRGIVLLHEACCHALEADEVLRGSTYTGLTGQPIAAEAVTIVDDPTLTGAVGRYEIDDEGTPARPTTLVRDGHLRSFLTTRHTARQLGTARTPNARCETILDPPIPRMSNTCLLAGAADPAEMIAGTKLGIYAEHVGGGEVVESTGDFVFRVNNGQMIRDGRLAEPIAETTIAGRGADVLRSIDAVGNDPSLGAARCGKSGQAVLVGVYGPTISVRSLLVGGTDG